MNPPFIVIYCTVRFKQICENAYGNTLRKYNATNSGKIQSAHAKIAANLHIYRDTSSKRRLYLHRQRKTQILTDNIESTGVIAARSF